MRLAIIVVTLALAFPAVATAKEVTRVDVCGADGCGRISDHGSLEAFMEGDDQPATVPFGPQRSYTLRVRMRAEEGEAVHGWTTHWIPKANVLAYQDEHGQFAFTDVPAKLRRALTVAARGHTARAARVFEDPPDPEAQVDEVVTAPPATARADAGGGLPALAWVGVAAGLLAVGGAGARSMRRR